MAKSLKEKVIDLVVPKKEEKKEDVVVEVPAGFDPDLPENKQRWTR